MENLVSSAERRALLNGERVICPRASDLIYMLPAMTGKMELSYSGEERGSEQVARRLIRQAVRVIFNEYFGHDDCQSTIDWFHEENRCFMLHDNMPATEIIALAEQVRGLTGRVDPLQRPEVLASGIEFMLEGLFAHKRLSKTEMHGQVRYG